MDGGGGSMDKLMGGAWGGLDAAMAVMKRRAMHSNVIL
jgi:hypothetical protein